MSSAYKEQLGLNQVPHYERRLGDVIRIGSFMAVKLEKQPEGTYTIVRLEERTREYQEDECCFETSVRLRLFLPLFPSKRFPCHKKIPKHSHNQIKTGTGSENIELYESSELRWMDAEGMETTIEVLFPVFVFTLQELEDPKNKWATGIHNVFVVRFWHHRNYSYSGDTDSLEPLPASVKFGFVNDHPKYKKPKKMIIPQRCYHSSIWRGLFTLQKHFIKLLNKRGLSSVNKEAISVNVGMIPMETLQYISMVVNTVMNLHPHPVTLSESYLHLNHSMQRSKFRISFDAGVLRFKSTDDLTVLRQIFGPSATYGSSERRPTLADGPQGLTLKRGHQLTVVRGQPPNTDTEESKFKRRCTEQRIDVTFSPYNVRVTACFERFVYNINDDGSLRDPAPCENLQAILNGKPPSRSIKHGKINDSTDDETSSSDDTHEDSLSTPIYIGDQFMTHGTVWEVTEIERCKTPATCTCRAIAGVQFDTARPKNQQDQIERQDLAQVAKDIQDFA